ncbi:hypothetical protein [Bradyrhizobium liaoningense]|uniref:hypothetical protein n=1 Tax=Bradyrhizobium liaoningense TaxID=43992 RepID=UPI001BAD7988|nr:hypothetical protein [Bradyrhizobium liaoningense]MBR0907957.1 hypothetical protein [Bradyrhizobium liaoningense]
MRKFRACDRRLLGLSADGLERCSGAVLQCDDGAVGELISGGFFVLRHADRLAVGARCESERAREHVIIVTVRRLDFTTACCGRFSLQGRRGASARIEKPVSRDARMGLVRSRRCCDTASAPDDANVKQITCALRRLRYCSAQPVVGC